MVRSPQHADWFCEWCRLWKERLIRLTMLLATMIVLAGMIWAAWRQFRERTIDPALADASERYDSVSDEVAERRGRIRRWLDTWRSKK